MLIFNYALQWIPLTTTHVICPATCARWPPCNRTPTEQNNLPFFFQKHLPLSGVLVVRYDIVIAAVQQRSE